MLTYTLLPGGAGRHELIAGGLERADADVVALQEASDLDLVEELGRRLGAAVHLGPTTEQGPGLNVAVLTRLPVRLWASHPHAGMLRPHLEVEVELPWRSFRRLRLHVVHLAARFGELRNGELRRMQEMGHVLRDIGRVEPAPHCIIGDFNALAPGDVVAATDFFARLRELREAGLIVRGDDGMTRPLPRPPDAGEEHDARWRAVDVHPRLDVGIPTLPAVVHPATQFLPRLAMLDRLLNTRLRRDTIAHLGEAGYVDCYRALHDDAGYTCATWMPAARIDYVMAAPELAPRLVDCDVIGGEARPDPDVTSASDHFPVYAEFAP
ncbi:MAG TPA: endonuclease/exonuclease/phosphatase family protein [Candidatus Dormibacteraeota bacterium]|nr:endonuclease/exonuclease/phosphatase family protein [Candidatus Dormibacteraeota bacterium]